MLGGSGRSATASFSSVAERRPEAAVVLVARDEELRLILRGLSLLHRHRVALEAPNLNEIGHEALDLATATLVFVAPEGDPSWRDELAAYLRARPEVRAVVLLAPAQESLRAAAIEAGAAAVLVRPFPLREFADALRTAGSPALGVPLASAAPGSGLSA